MTEGTKTGGIYVQWLVTAGYLGFLVWSVYSRFWLLHMMAFAIIVLVLSYLLLFLLKYFGGKVKEK